MFFPYAIILICLGMVTVPALAAEEPAKPRYNFEKKITQEMVDDFMLNIGNVYNNRKKDLVESFFSYYADRDARFIATSYSVDPENPEGVLQNEGMNLSRDEFIIYLGNRLKTPEKYFFRYSDTSFKLNNPTEALVSFHYDEISVSQSLKTPTTEQFTKLLVSANCNMNVQLSGSGLKIMGLNCIEKIAQKNLQVEN